MFRKSSSQGNLSGRRAGVAAAAVATAVEPLERRQMFAAGDLGFGFTMPSVPLETGTNDFGQAVATDAQGNVYVAGAFAGIADFDPSKGQARRQAAGGRDAFVAKYSAAGKFLWAHRVGGKGFDTASAIALDKQGRVVVGGSFFSSTDAVDFNPGKGQANLIGRGKSDGFVLTLTSSGKFVRVALLGGAGEDFVDHVGVDGQDNVYAFGTFSGTARFGAKRLTTAYFDESFGAKISAAGTVQWAAVMGGPRTNNGANSGRAFDAAVAPDGSIALAGAFAGTVDFRPGKQKFLLTSHGTNKTDLYVARYTTDGAFVWARGIGGNGDDNARGVTFDNGGNVITTGTFQQTVDFNPGIAVANVASAGATGTKPAQDAFVYKLDAGGNYVWAKGIGANSAYEEGSAVSTDAQGNVYVAGAFESKVDFDPGAGKFELNEVSKGLGSLYVLKLTSGGAFAYAKAVLVAKDTEGFAFPTSIKADAAGNVIVTGSLSGVADFDPGAGTSRREASIRSNDTLLLKLLA